MTAGDQTGCGPANYVSKCYRAELNAMKVRGRSSSAMRGAEREPEHAHVRAREERLGAGCRGGVGAEATSNGRGLAGCGAATAASGGPATDGAVLVGALVRALVGALELGSLKVATGKASAAAGAHAATVEVVGELGLGAPRLHHDRLAVDGDGTGADGGLVVGEVAVLDKGAALCASDGSLPGRGLTFARLTSKYFKTPNWLRAARRSSSLTTSVTLWT
jgi:hypothetical protein